MRGRLPITTVADLASSFLSNSVKMEVTMGKFSMELEVSGVQMNKLEIEMILFNFIQKNEHLQVTVSDYKRLQEITRDY